MVYRKLGNIKATPSAIGLGTMRLPLNSGLNPENVNTEAAVNIIEIALSQGINYIDTAWPYLKGKSEYTVGIVLRNHRRENLYVATKSPIWEIHNIDDFFKILDEQLKRLHTDYIDFYLLHALGKERWEQVLNKDILYALHKVKREGIVKNIGFSFHDNFDVFKKIIDGYQEWDFCQIQYNYRDTDKQAGTRGLKYAASKGLGIIVMEPLKGGELVQLPCQVANLFPEYRTSIEWGLDFLWDKPEVGVVLSGMSSAEQVFENIGYANKSHIGMLSNAERNLYKYAKKVFDTSPLVPCTKCKYCSCLQGLQISELIEAYNWIYSKDYMKAKELYSKFSLKADACTSCKVCESFCPQKIEISSIMKDIAIAFSQSVLDIDMEALMLKWPERYKKILEKNNMYD